MPLYKREQKVAVTCKEAFRVKKKIAKELRRRKQRIQYRLRDINWKEQSKPMFAGGNIHYEMAGRKIVYRILSWNPWLAAFFRGFRGLRYSPG